MQEYTKKFVAELFVPLFEVDDVNVDPDVNVDLDASDKYTKEQVEKMIQQRLSTSTKAQEKLNNEIESLKQRGQLTAQEKKELEDRLEQIQNETLTKEQLASKERKKLEQQSKKQIEDLTNDINKWKTLHTNSTIERDLLDAASANKAISPQQLVKLLRADSELVEELDKEKQPTGRLTTRVTIIDTDDKGEPVKLRLTPQEAIKRMKEMEDCENLFEYEGKGGFGGRNRPAGGTASDLRDLAAKDPKAYIEGRKAGKISLQ